MSSLVIQKKEQRKLGQDKPVYTSCGWNHQPSTCPDAGDIEDREEGKAWGLRLGPRAASHGQPGLDSPVRG